MSPGGVTLLIQTRWHVDDLAGRLLDRMEAGGDKWDILTMPAISEQDELIGGEVFRRAGEPLWPERYSLAELTKIRDGMSRYWWS